MPFPGISGMWPQQNPLVPLSSRTFIYQATLGGMTVINVFQGLRTGSSKLALRVQNNATTAITLNGTYIGPRIAVGQPYAFASTPTLVTWNGGSTPVTIAAGATVTSDELDYAITSTLLVATNVGGNKPSDANARYIGNLPQTSNLTYTSYQTNGCSIRSSTRNTTLGAIVFTTTVPATTTARNHNLRINDPFYFGNGTITGLTAGTIYYVKSVPSLNTFTLTTTPGGPVFYPASNPTITGTVYLCPQTAGIQAKAAGYYPFALGANDANSGVQSIFSAILVRNP